MTKIVDIGSKRKEAAKEVRSTIEGYTQTMLDGIEEAGDAVQSYISIICTKEGTLYHSALIPDGEMLEMIGAIERMKSTLLFAMSADEDEDV